LKFQFSLAEIVGFDLDVNNVWRAHLLSLGKQKIADQIAHLKYKEPTSPKITVLEQELVRAEAESLVAEAQLSNITREKVKAAFNYQFDAVREHCEKLAVIAGYGKHLLELIDDTPVTPGETRDSYDGYEASRA
jgi:Eisosome component PIL1